MKTIWNKYKHYLLLLYGPLYLAAFHWLETLRPERIHILDTAFDHCIPFMEIFIVPYIMWFFYIGISGAWFFFKEKDSFCRMMIFGIIGMTLFLIVSWIYPNGLTLRPQTFARDNVFVHLVRWIYSMDTATNVLPSIHVFNSVGVCCAIHSSRKLEKHRAVQGLSTLVTVLIILSTMFIKQHSIVDVTIALAMSYLCWELVYNSGVSRIAAAYAEYKLRRSKKPQLRWLNK
ncbi:MAG: serine/threonine protein phosphatase [Eubacterium sp.]|nr:serine/threonine protein phosphatase [Eubacterium sp.]